MLLLIGKRVVSIITSLAVRRFDLFYRILNGIRQNIIDNLNAFIYFKLRKVVSCFKRIFEFSAY